eukprot:XP_019073650.1 PREDICTED: uncharacterized protein LOC104878161 [Vitis vinifera]
MKTDLQNRVAEEAKGNAILQASLERRKQALQECRSALEQDIVWPCGEFAPCQRREIIHNILCCSHIRNWKLIKSRWSFLRRKIMNSMKKSKGFSNCFFEKQVEPFSRVH